MSRKPHTPATSDLDDHPVVAVDDAALREIDQNAIALADKLAYDGPLTLAGAKDHARMQMRRTIAECLELGKTLLIIKELTPHGGFRDHIEADLGMDYTAAKRFMQAAMKFSKGAPAHLLPAVGTQSKLLELLVLDDGEIAELSENGSVRGVALDEIETMTAKELRAALRKAREDATGDLEAKDRMIATQSQQIQKLHKDVARAQKQQAEFSEFERRDYECAPLHQTIAETMVGLAKMSGALARLTEHGVPNDLVGEECYHAVLMPIKRALDMAAQHGLHINLESLTEGDYDPELDALMGRVTGLGEEVVA